MQRTMKTATAAAALMVLAAGLAWAAQLLSVQVRAGQLRDKPGFLSKVVGELEYGDRVDLKAEKGDWRQVRSMGDGRSGWMHFSALTEREIILNPTDKDVQAAASSDELALAGKGFNKQVEDRYRKQTRLDYAQVDEMEKIAVPQKYIREFILAGRLGGAQ
ncbi:SH3 domain-containing protein [Pseudodesulfovibrio karagichevae]|uniref:SH3 domain-containing protein n=1 Tax=Pseudodesulfovibrio karagichevae TaxID=3239305 RepID=A0ABV4JWY6_9BACT